MNGSLATPYALGMLLGLTLMFFALRGLDEKHSVLGGRLSNIGAASGPGEPIFGPPGDTTEPPTGGGIA